MPPNGVFRRLFANAWGAYRKVSYSQEGEDRILSRIFERKKQGFYVDVGAHHPYRFSNTCLFYKQGWSGINVDPLPGFKVLFDSARPRDLNLEIAVLKERRRLRYFQFNEPAYNGFSEELSKERAKKADLVLTGTLEVEGWPLRDIFDKYLPVELEIDFLSVDVEGLDIDVLESNDWQRFRPRVVLAEIRSSSLDALGADPVCDLMLKNDYSIFAKSMQTVFFLSKEFMTERSIAPDQAGQ